MLNNFKKDLQKLADPAKAKNYARFFKTGKGEYGEGDNFLGVIAPQQRKVAVKYKDLELKDLQELLSANIHEYRLTALFILVSQYKKVRDGFKPSLTSSARKLSRKEIVKFYLKNTKNINNWDLVDSSAHCILGDYLLQKMFVGDGFKPSPVSNTPMRDGFKPSPTTKYRNDILYKLAKSKNLWEKRIAIISTFAFIRDGQFEDALKIAKILLNDKHDLIHKAVGWMLREVGKRDQKVEEELLQKYYQQMPRTMLRYAIEKFPEKKRKYYLDIR